MHGDVESRQRYERSGLDGSGLHFVLGVSGGHFLVEDGGRSIRLPIEEN
jgi:hypothetical protein